MLLASAVRARRSRLLRRDPLHSSAAVSPHDRAAGGSASSADPGIQLAARGARLWTAAVLARRIEENLRATARAQARLGAVYWLPRALGELTIVGLAVGYMLLKGAGIETTACVPNWSVIAFAGLRLLPAFAQGMANVSYLQTGRRVTRILARSSSRRQRPRARMVLAGGTVRAFPVARAEAGGIPLRGGAKRRPARSIAHDPARRIGRCDRRLRCREKHAG